MTVSDDRCLDKWIRERDRDSFLELVARHGGMVYGTALRITNDPDTALKIAIACFEKLMRLDSFPQVPVLIFLHREATRSALEVVKPLPLPTEPVSFPTWNDIKNRIDVLIANLTDKYSQPLLLHFLEGHAPANLVSYLRLPREKIEEHIEKGVEHLRRGLSLLKINITSAQLFQLLSSNTYEPSPTALTDNILNLLDTFSTSGGIKTTKEEKKPSKFAVVVPVLSILIVVLMFLLSVYLIFKERKLESKTESIQSFDVSQEKFDTEEPRYSKSLLETQEGEKKSKEVEGEQVAKKREEASQIVIDLEKKLFELVYARYEERKKAIQSASYSSQNFMPTDPFYYYFLALESLPPIDSMWIQQLWDSLFSMGPTGVPENFRVQMGTLSEVFSQWRSGAMLERDGFPPVQLPGQVLIPVDSFQTLIELISINILLSSAPQSEQSFQDVQVLHRFSVGAYKSAYGDLVHIPLHGFECVSIVLRELSRFKLLPQNMFRDTMRILLDAEKTIQDSGIIKYNEYRQIANWAESEFPTLVVLRESLKNFVSSPAEKDYINKLSDSDLQSSWDNFLRLPAVDKKSSVSYPLEELRKMIFPTDFAVDSHRTHADSSLLIGKLIVAIEWFGLEGGLYPSSIDVLVPNYIPEIKQELLQQIGLQYIVDLNTNLYQVQLSDESLSWFPWRGGYMQ
ncbi:MAG: hypothetical protein N3G21_10260 [Candidatus Hydrogenedentes bacterium]|nr:hypothetical protein [Candidatus Hydrogenedentota bacterium]